MIGLTGLRLAMFLPLLVLGGCDGSSLDADAGPQADIVFYGDNIITLSDQSGPTNFVAVKDDTIIFVGQRDDWDGRATEVVNLNDSALLPGFIDAHGHISFHGRVSAMANVSSPPVGPAEDMRGLVAELKRHMASKSLAAGDWVVGMGYDDSLLAEKRHPTITDLDEVSTSHPILLIHVSGHLAAVNSKALEIAGIDHNTPNPPGGVIRRMAGSQKPNGVLEETAGFSIQTLITSSADPMKQLHDGLLDYASYGITTAQEGAASEAAIKQLRSASKIKPFPIDVVAYQRVDARYLGDDTPALPILGDYENGFRVGGVKMILDGSPQGKTAYLTEPYTVPPEGAADDYRGYPIMAPESIDKLFAKFIGAGIPILAHANGDAAADLFVSGLQNAIDKDNVPDHRTVMIHAQTVREDQLSLMAKMKAIPSFFSAHTFYWGDWHRDSVLGTERASRISPTASSLEKGIIFTVHNDAPVVPPNMIRLLWATTNRITRSGQVLGEEQRISTLDAIKAITVNAAYQYFEEDIKGTIDVGKQADFVILSKNPLAIPTTELLDVTVERTIARGKTIFEIDG
ncbi:MAG: amidohydrolase family protein [SAR86 cluster bacterium]|uniref:Amidohydrolase family protein n=1 Tax=SAR86 cluster bacterium TaxID=2030880 RepID=A0A972VVT1_9GAMM|nr:amidohydrolase family protein [SAR86 cluster bacterium]